MNIGAPELLIILAVVLLIFGPTKLPDLARSLGSAAREFRNGLDSARDTPGRVRRGRERVASTRHAVPTPPPTRGAASPLTLRLR